ncbi:MAG: hypothetical protein CBARDCOR_3552 [uncultured Caballeronia sp.]|nr:MAG: hypothetical protein CBARDCOR_3552 [uncultured Caballeronia sp.]
MSKARSLDVGVLSVAIGSGSAGFPSEAGSIRINGPSAIDHGQRDLARNVIDVLSLAADHGSSLAPLDPSVSNEPASALAMGTAIGAQPVWNNRPVAIDSGQTNFPLGGLLNPATDHGASLQALDPLAYSDLASSVSYGTSAGTQPIWANGPDTIGIDQTGSPLNNAAHSSLLPVTEFPTIDPRISPGWNDGLRQLMPLSSDGHLSSEGVSFSFGDVGGRDTRSVDAGKASIMIGSNSGSDRSGGEVPITIGKGQTNISAHNGSDNMLTILDKHTLNSLPGQTDRWVTMTSTGESAALFDASDRGVHIHGSASANTPTPLQWRAIIN